MKILTVFMVSLMTLLSHPHVWAQVPIDSPPLTLSTPELSIRINPKKAWTIDQIQYKGKPLSTTNSNYSLVIDLGGNKFVGSGHTEGGKEEVLSVQIEADGKPVNLAQGGMVQGKKFVLTKQSKVAFLDLKNTVRLSGGTLEEENAVTVRENGTISKMYGLMYAWVSTTSEWMAKTVGGRDLEGSFDNTGWEMQDDVRWSALYDPASQTAILTEFPPDLPAAVGQQHAYWDISAYHKQYYQPFTARELKAGEKYRFAAKVRAFPASVTNWKQIVRQAVDKDAPVVKSPVQQEIERRFPPIATGEKPAWLAHPVGMEALDPNTVLKPWTPVKATAHQVEVWNRRYQVGDWGLPRNMQIGGQEFLSAPLTFELKTEGGASLHPAARLHESFPGLARYTAQGSAGNVQVNANTSYEYDGFVRTDIELAAPANTRAREWELVIPFKPENAKYFSAIHASGMKMESMQKNSVTGAIPEGEGEVWSSDFRPLVWLGNRDAGLCWFSESREFWSPEVNPKAIRIVRTNGRVELRVAFIAQPSPLPRTMKLSFGLMATPVRPRPTGWRGWDFMTHQSVDGHKQTGAEMEKYKPRGDQIIYWHDSWRITLMYPRPRDPQAFHDEVQFLKKHGARRIYPYVVASHITGSEKTHIPGEDFVFTAPEWKAFGHEWELNPNRQPENFRRMSPGSSFADFHLAAIKDWITQDGINGIYVDEAYPYPDTVASHGMGYADSKGVRQPTYQIYSMRNYFKRMAYLFQRYGEGSPAIIAHASGVLSMPFLSFVDVFLEGEQAYYPIQAWKGEGPPSYMEMFPLDKWSAEFSGRAFGYVPLFMPAMRPNLAPGYPDLNKQVAPTREMLAIAQLHDVLVWPLWSNAQEWRNVVAVRQEFGIGDEDVKFYPFWETATAAKASGENVLVSSYTGSRGIYAIVTNMEARPQEVTVDFARLPFKIGGGWKAWNAQSKAALPRTGNTVNLTVPPKDFVLVRLAP